MRELASQGPSGIACIPSPKHHFGYQLTQLTALFCCMTFSQLLGLSKSEFLSFKILFIYFGCAGSSLLRADLL